jgi:murein DD-endopeptidase MepM/ murein hydrolase activator NlpD
MRLRYILFLLLIVICTHFSEAKPKKRKYKKPIKKYAPVKKTVKASTSAKKEVKTTPLTQEPIFVANKSSAGNSMSKNDNKVTANPPKDFLQIKTPNIQYTKPDTSSISEEEIEGGEDFDEGSSDDIIFDPSKEPSIVSDDSSNLEDGELSVVEEDEEVKFNDSTWVKIAEYYSIWDSRAVNPYRIDATKFKDTVALKLYDSEKGRDWHPPLRNSILNSDFGMRWSRFHYGVDLDLDVGDSVFAVFDGVVRIAKFDGRGYGKYIMLRHYNGLETLYGHLSKQLVSPGQYVKAGDLIGLGGSTGRSTGPHLHFEVRFEGNAINPEYFFDFNQNLLRDDETEITAKQFEYLKIARRVTYHRVRSGETLSQISRKYRVPVLRICKLNRISTRTILRPGRRLRIK